MNRRDFVKNSGKLVAGAAAVSAFGKLSAQDPGPNNLCGPGCNLGGGQFQYLDGSLHRANATRYGAQCTAFKNGTLTNAYASETISGYTVPAVANLQDYGYCESLRTLALNWVHEYNGGAYGPLTQAQISAMVTAGASWGYAVTAAEANAMNALFNNATVKANVAAAFNTAGSVYSLLQFFEGFNTWVNWQDPPAGPIGDEPDYELIAVQSDCDEFIAMGVGFFSSGVILSTSDPAIGFTLEAIGGYFWLGGALCNGGGYLTFGDSSGFTD